MRLSTSWDDGHPADLRIAELLSKHNLRATFYVPKESQRPTLGVEEVRLLADRFEIGAHTNRHLALTSLSSLDAQSEIEGSKAWVEQTTGLPCAAFCPPLGKFNREHVEMISNANFLGFRTVELLSLDAPRILNRVREIPTTLQAHPHGRLPLLRNVVKRASVKNFWHFLRMQGRSWVDQLKWFSRRVDTPQSVLHLWGHSWEIDEYDQWNQLERAFEFLGELVRKRKAVSLTNSELLL